jgi:hypothetical protein
VPGKEEFVMEDDQLRAVLREWEAPEPNSSMDARVRAVWRASHPPAWKRIWLARVSVPAPVLAVLLLVVAFLLVKFGVARHSTAETPSGNGSYVTQLNATGFQPVANGEARVITLKEVQ